MGIYGSYAHKLFESNAYIKMNESIEDTDRFIKSLTENTIILNENKFTDWLSEIGKKIIEICKAVINFIKSIPGKILSLFKKKEKKKETPDVVVYKYEWDKSAVFPDDWIDYSTAIEDLNELHNNYHLYLLGGNTEKDVEFMKEALDKVENKLYETGLINKKFTNCKDLESYKSFLDNDLENKYNKGKLNIGQIDDLNKGRKFLRLVTDFKKVQKNWEDTERKVQDVIDKQKKTFDLDKDNFVDSYVSNKVHNSLVDTTRESLTLYLKYLAVAQKVTVATERKLIDIYNKEKIQDNKYSTFRDQHKHEVKEREFYKSNEKDREDYKKEYGKELE